MKDKDVRIGMKVVPHDKTVYSVEGLETSNEWKKAKAKKQRFLYITGKRYDFYVLNTNENDPTGDFFNVSDFEPYVDIELMVEQLSKARLQPLIDILLRWVS